MAITQAQNGAVTSSAPSPTSVVFVFSQATTANTLLVVSIGVTATSSGANIVTPGGWTRVDGQTTPTFATAVFILQNNAGGLSGLTVTVTATGGGAVGAFAEYNGLGAIQTVEFHATQTGNGTAVPIQETTATPNTQELHVLSVHHPVASPTYTPRTPEWSIYSSGASTGASPNLGNDSLFAVNPASSQPQVSGTLGAGGAWSAILIRIVTGLSSPIQNSVIAGNPTVAIPSFYQGMIGG